MSEDSSPVDQGDTERTKAQARRVAIRVLNRFAQSTKSMHAVLRDFLREEHPETDLFMMVQALTMSTVRYLNTIDFVISRSRPPIVAKELPGLERSALRLAVYEGRWLRTPLNVLESTYLENYEHLRPALSRAVSAPLNRLTARLSEEERLGVLYSHPTFLVSTLIEHLPRDEVVDLLRADLEPRTYYVRPNLLRFNAVEMVASLLEQGIDTVPDPDVEGLFRVVQGADKIVRSSLFKEGKILIQDKASVLTVRALDPKPGETVWDACAAPGMKTQAIWEMMGREGRLVASDIHEGRLRAAVERAASLGYSDVCWIRTDASTAPVREADKILIDAPCTSTGILRSRPSFKWRLNKRVLMGIMSIQHKILDGIVSAYAGRHGVRILYATCSLLPHEGESQIDSLLSSHSIKLLDVPIKGASPGYSGFECSDKVRRFFPHRHDTSGFFIALFEIV
ncbi:MAG: hypothetical protein DRO93_06550 [Candidatus Thorarchaeota archaeon]|nr:MAG: hypothetical protein DRO93_06550 [Candidatus Thorarchaeota archaeon]